MTREFLTQADKERLHELYVAYHSPWNEEHLQAIFKKFYPEKSVSTSMLRHIYLTSKYGKVKEEMKKDAELLAHSVEQQKSYIKEKE